MQKKTPSGCTCQSWDVDNQPPRLEWHVNAPYQVPRTFEDIKVRSKYTWCHIC